MNDTTGPNKALVGIIIVALIAIIAGGGYIVSQSSNDDQAKITEQSNSASKDTASDTSVEEDQVATAGTYKNGTYKATGSYNSPGGRESIKLALTIADGKVSDSTVTSEAKNPTAKSYQADFISGYKTQVVGKSVDEIKLDSVAGSSLTPDGFEDALEQIKQDAAA